MSWLMSAQASIGDMALKSGFWLSFLPDLAVVSHLFRICGRGRWGSPAPSLLPAQKGCRPMGACCGSGHCSRSARTAFR